jgi:murein DD-endopeptidase MepM/ murein hydrolase activator NlpD
MKPRTTASSTASSSITEPSDKANQPLRRLLVLVALPLAALLLWPVPSPAAPQPTGFRSLEGTVTPKRTVPLAVGPQRIIFRFRARRSLPIEVKVIRIDGGRTVRRFVTGPLRPGRWHRKIWNGLDQRGRLVAAGRYLVRIGPAGGRLRTLARPKLYGHLFPVDGPHGIRGSVGEFGAARNGGRIHEGFDVTAACGTPLVAVRSGTVLKVASDPELKGYYVVLKGRSERRTYLYAHLIRPAPVRKGQFVRAGRRLGTVGQTGNAASTPCHLHIEVRTRGRLLDPEPLLSSWLD